MYSSVNPPFVVTTYIKAYGAPQLVNILYVVLKRIVNFIIQIVGNKMTKYSINLFPKAIYKKRSKSLAKELIIKEITDNQIITNKNHLILCGKNINQTN